MKNIRFVLLFVLLIFVFATAVSASSGTCGNNANWEYDDSSKTLYISGTGKIDDVVYSWNGEYNEGYIQPWFEHREEIKKVVIKEGITAIGSNVFIRHANLSSIALPRSLLIIDGYAFSNTSIEAIYIPKNLEMISPEAFTWCYDLKSIMVDENNATYASVDGVLFDKNLKSLIKYPSDKESIKYTIPDSVTEISSNAFLGNRNAKRIELPKSLECIGNYAFTDMKALQEIEIPSNTWYIGDMNFVFCYSLTSIQVEENNTTYASEDGVLFDKDKTKLIAFPADKKTSTYKIPETVTHILDAAFSEQTSIERVFLPKHLEYVGYSAFSDCQKLSTICIPDSVKLIMPAAFESCPRLSDVYFFGDLPYVDYPEYYGADEDIPYMPIEYIFTTFDESHEIDIYYLPEKKGWNEISEELGLNMDYADYLKEYGIHLIPCDLSDMPTDEPEEPLWSAVVTFDDASVNPDVTESNETETSLVLGSCGDDAIWNYNKNARILTISGTGELSYRYNDGPWHDYDEDIEKVIIEEGITAINNYAFSDCIALKEIVLPSTLNSIEYSAFYNCSSLKSVVLPDSVTSLGEGAFTESGLESIILSDGMTLLDQGVFSCCHNLKSVVIPKSITTIKGYVFYQCESLETIYYTGSKEAWSKISIDTDGNDFLTLEEVHIVFDASEEQKRIEDEDSFLKTIKPYLPYFAIVFIGGAVIIFVICMANHKSRQTSKKTHIQKDSTHTEALYSNNRNTSSYRNTKQEVSTCKCPTCGFLCEPGSLFCGNCGKSFAGLDAHTCPECGTVLSDDAVFCSTCGKKIKQ